MRIAACFTKPVLAVATFFVAGCGGERAKFDELQSVDASPGSIEAMTSAVPSASGIDSERPSGSVESSSKESDDSLSVEDDGSPSEDGGFGGNKSADAKTNGGAERSEPKEPAMNEGASTGLVDVDASAAEQEDGQSDITESDADLTDPENREPTDNDLGPGSEPCSTPNERKCVGDVAWECQAGGWTEAEMCAAGCTGAGVCIGPCDGIMCLAPMCKEAGMCDPASGSCSAPTNADDGSSCDDGNACTQTDSCQSGSCVGANPVTCPAAEICKVAGACDPASGSCSAPTNAQNGSACDDGDACTESDTCQTGVCIGSQILCNSPVACKLNTTCSAGECNYTDSVPDGTKDTKCPSGKQYCASGSCVGCLQDAHCSGSTPSCDLVTKSCTCRVPSPSNLLQNPGFEGSFDGWNSQSVLTLATDSEDCSMSNSVSVKVTGGSTSFQCISLSPGNYYIGGRFKGGSAVAVGLEFYSGNCSSNLHASAYVHPSPPTSFWGVDSQLVTAPEGTESAYFSVYTEAVLYMDQLYISSVDNY